MGATAPNGLRESVMSRNFPSFAGTEIVYNKPVMLEGYLPYWLPSASQPSF